MEYTVGEINIDPSEIADVLSEWESHLASITVSTELDLVDGDTSSVDALQLSPGDDGEISLREAIIAANSNPDHDVIHLLSDSYTLNDTQDTRGGDHFGDLNVINPVTIQGTAGTVIDGNDTNRIFSFNNAGTSLLSSLTLQNGNVTSGGADGVEGDSGGGVFVEGTDLSIESVDFTGNKAVFGGGLFQNGGTINLNDVNLTQNESTVQGGGLFLQFGLANLTDVTLKENKTPNQGGGLYLQGGTFNLNDVTITENTSINNQGGGIYFNDGLLNISDSRLTANTAGFEGGGLYMNDGTAIISGTEFSENHTNHATNFGKGGAVLVNAGVLTTTDTTFKNNTSDDGGALFINGEVLATDTSFIENEADTRADSRGGAVFASGTFELDRGLFESNTANNGGGLFNEATAIVRDTTFGFNHANNDGGAIQAANAGSETEIVRSTIAKNTAGNSRSAIDVQAGNVEIQGSIVVNNPGFDDIHPDVISNGYNLTKIPVSANPLPSDILVSFGDTIGIEQSLTPVKPGSDLKVFKLDSNSIAINAGTLIGTENSQPIVDATGLSRNSALDIGAYEYPQAESDVILYWGDNFEDNIHRFIVDTEQHERIIDTGIDAATSLGYDSTTDHPVNLEIDPENGQLYWIESNIDRLNADPVPEPDIGNLNTASLSGDLTLQNLATGLSQPLGLAIDTANERLFVSENSAPSNSATDAILEYSLDGNLLDTTLTDGLPSIGQTPIGFIADIEYRSADDSLHWTDLGHVDTGTFSDRDSANIGIRSLDSTGIVSPIANNFGDFPIALSLGQNNSVYWVNNEEITHRAANGTITTQDNPLNIESTRDCLLYTSPSPRDS